MEPETKRVEYTLPEYYFQTSGMNIEHKARETRVVCGDRGRKRILAIFKARGLLHSLIDAHTYVRERATVGHLFVHPDLRCLFVKKD